MKIKTLSEQFFKKGSFYKLEKRIGDIAIYSQSYSTDSCKIGFDVVRVRKYTSDYLNAKTGKHESNEWDLIECYPSSEHWGAKAWSFDNLEKAIEKFDSLQKNVLTND